MNNSKNMPRFDLIELTHDIDVPPVLQWWHHSGLLLVIEWINYVLARTKIERTCFDDMIIAVSFFLKITVSLLHCCWWGSFYLIFTFSSRDDDADMRGLLFAGSSFLWHYDLLVLIHWCNSICFNLGKVPCQLVVVVVVVCCWCCVAVVFARKSKPRHLCGCCRSCCCCVLIKLSSAAVWYDFSVCSGGGGRVHDEVHWFRWYGGSCW